MARLLAPHFERIVVSTPGTFKQSDPKSVWESFHSLREDAVLELDPGAALDTVLDGTNVPILVTGSFYMIAEIRSRLSPAFVRTP
jgi:dihydrofolate synthase/folylpolyglutamate synthase